MLAAMSTAPLPPSSQATAVSRDRGDACPGSLRLHTADDGALARVRVPGGVLTLPQAEALADAADRLGDGELHLTSRGNVQVRGLRDDCGALLAGLLDAAGLLPSRGHERARNIVASPLSGLDGRGVRDVRPWLSALDASLCASEAAPALSGRFLFALDDGRGDVAGLGADVTVRAAGDGGALLAVGSADGALRVSGDEAPRAALLAAETFLEVLRETGARVWRVDELNLSPGELTRVVRSRLTGAGLGCVPAPNDRTTGEGPPLGVVGAALSVHVPLGRLTSRQWRTVTRVAAEVRSDEVRLTPWRGIVVPAAGTNAAAAADALARLAGTGLVTDASSPWLRVGACIGRPGCGRSRSDVRADAAGALADAGRSPLPLYWSGCERRCGHPRGDRIDVVAAPEGGYRIGTVALGRPARTAALDDPSHLAAALAALTS
ncbi:precorrin-3B synthase [Streptomyces sp. NPDC085927]|uniref:precorrin-3B synthase n=1 Tax=Streptomyces sp. NPDC085927 TaxID=3365738 RepID=UPI0037CD1CBD